MSAEQLLRDTADRYAEPDGEECFIYGIPVADIPDDCLRGLLRWTMYEHRTWRKQKERQWEMLDTIRRARL